MATATLLRPKYFIGPHQVCRREIGRGYPTRFRVSDDKVRFSAPFSSYAPPEYTARVVLEQYARFGDEGWADGPEKQDERATLKNPEGRTGMRGRGLLGRFGANIAADVLITKGQGDDVLLLCILRKDRSEWALPGGMLDVGESPKIAAARELFEETGIRDDLAEAVEVYAGYVDDPRNTDEAWMETHAFHAHLDDDTAGNLSFVAGDDAAKVAWRDVGAASLKTLYASHARLVLAALDRLV